MKLYIKQRVFSWADTFFVYDADGNEKYSVKGEVFSLGRKLHLYDASGSELAFVRQKMWSFLPRYFIERNGTTVAEVVKRFTFFRHEYEIKELGWTVKGDFFDHSYTVSAGENVIASVEKEWMTFGDAYEITLSDGVDVVTALAVVLVIDACIDDQNNN